MKKICEICGDEIISNGFKYIHARMIGLTVFIGAKKYDHEAVCFNKLKNEDLMTLEPTPKSRGSLN